MKIRFLATLAMTGAAAAAIAAAPMASATAADVNRTETSGSTAIRVSPPSISDARSYGQFSSPAPFMGSQAPFLYR